MITRIHAENFKSWKDTGELRLAPLTGFFGTNSSGKTSILQTLLMMKQTVESSDRRQVLRTGDERSLVDLGTFRDLIHGHQTDAKLRLSFSWKPPEPLIINDPAEQGKELFNVREIAFTTDIRMHPDLMIVDRFFYEFDNYKFGMLRSPISDTIGLPRYNITCSGYPKKQDWQDSQNILPPPIKNYGFPDVIATIYPDMSFLPDFVLALEDMFHRVVYLGPLRDYPRRLYLWSGELPSSVGTQGEKAIDRLIASRAAVHLKSFEYVEKTHRKINGWLREIGLIHSFSINRLTPDSDYYEIRIQTSEKSPKVSIADVGFGIPQVLPVIVQCYYAPENSIILLEQPEIHLHPSAQAGLADVFIDALRGEYSSNTSGKLIPEARVLIRNKVERNVQIIFESHSEHLLRRIQRRIAEREISPDKVALYFCRMENGESRIEELDVDESGNIRNWPEKFFGDEMGDLVAMTEAAMDREMKSRS